MDNHSVEQLEAQLLTPEQRAEQRDTEASPPGKHVA